VTPVVVAVGVAGRLAVGPAESSPLSAVADTIGIVNF
jgi:hypothetical protein